MSKAQPLKHPLADLELKRLKPGKYQPRQHFDPQGLEELAQSIRANGLIQPVIVRPLSGDFFEIIAGERRCRAAQMASLEAVPCLIKHYTDEQAAAASTIENINRVDLNPIEEAQSYQRLIDEFDYQHHEVAAIVGRSRASVTNFLRLLRLDVSVQQKIIEKQLSEGHGKILAALPLSEQAYWAKRCMSQDLSVRKLERLLNKSNRSHSKTQATNTQKSADIQHLERHLGDYLGCPVTLSQTNKHCQLQIDCYDFDVLEGLLDKIGYTKHMT